MCETLFSMDRPSQEESKFEDFYFIDDSYHRFPLRVRGEDRAW